LAAPFRQIRSIPPQVIAALARAAEPGLVETTGPRYFGFVTGGALPATVAAEWLTAAWDQNVGLFVMSPAGAVVEEVAGAWLRDLLGLPASSSVGFVSGCHMANFTGLAAARHEMLRRAGWDVEADGLRGAPPLRVLVAKKSTCPSSARCGISASAPSTCVASMLMRRAACCRNHWPPRLRLGPGRRLCARRPAT